MAPRKKPRKSNRTAVRADRKTNKGGVKMVNVDPGRDGGSSGQTEEQILAAKRSAAMDDADFTPLVPQPEELPATFERRKKRRAKLQEDIKEGPTGGSTIRAVSKSENARLGRRLRSGATAPAGGTGAGQAPTAPAGNASHITVDIHPNIDGSGAVGAPYSGDQPIGTGTVPQGRVMRTPKDIKETRRRARNRRAGGRGGRIVSSGELSQIATVPQPDVKSSRRLRSFTEAKAPGDVREERRTPPEKVSEQRIYYANRAREADVATVTRNVTTRQIKEHQKAFGIQPSKEDVNAALSDNKITKEEAKALSGPRMRVGRYEDTASAVEAGHITHEEAMDISPEYHARHVVPTADKYVHSDEAMIQELSHHLGHRTSTIRGYLESTNAPVKEFRDMVVRHVKGEGKQTAWVPSGDAKKPWKSVSWNPTGKVRTRQRKGLANLTVTHQVPSAPPEGSISHIDYLKKELKDYADSAPTSTTRARGSHPITGAILAQMMQNNPDIRPVEVTTHGYGGSVTKGTDIVKPTGRKITVKSDKPLAEGQEPETIDEVETISRGKKRVVTDAPSGGSEPKPPKGATGKVNITKDGETVTSSPAGYARVRNPRKRLR